MRPRNRRSFYSCRRIGSIRPQRPSSTSDAAALAKLPADERKAFTELRSDIAALLKEVAEAELAAAGRRAPVDSPSSYSAERTTWIRVGGSRTNPGGVYYYITATS